MNYESFNSQEAAILTGVSQAQQRNLRRRNDLPPLHTTRSSYSGGGLLFLKTLNELSLLGIGPMKAKSIADKASDIAFYYALRVKKGRGNISDAAREWKEERGLEPSSFVIISKNKEIYTDEIETYYSKNDDPAIALVLNLEALGIKIANAVDRPFVTK